MKSIIAFFLISLFICSIQVLAYSQSEIEVFKQEYVSALAELVEVNIFSKEEYDAAIQAFNDLTNEQLEEIMNDDLEAEKNGRISVEIN